MFDKKLLEELKLYLDEHLIINMEDEIVKSVKQMDFYQLEDIHQDEIEDFIKINRQPTLKQVLFDFIDTKALTDTEVYKKAGIDRKLFSKIRSNPDYHPRKNTIIALALALELTKKETEKLLSSAGYSLSESDTSDLIIQFCIEKKIYNLQFVNEALDNYNLKPLTGVLKFY
jgi:hypothetical protein